MEEFLVRARHQLFVRELAGVVALAGVLDFVKNESSAIEADARRATGRSSRRNKITGFAASTAVDAMFEQRLIGY